MIAVIRPTLSIVIPALNEEYALGRLLQDIRCCQAKTDLPLECIVVDGGSVDGTRDVCQQFGVRVIDAPRGRGRQLRAGGEAAAGEVLLFLHADSRLTPSHCLVAVETVEKNNIFAGTFRLAFDDRHPILKLAERLNLIRFRMSRVAYGDHGIFLSRENYRTVGGFPPHPLFEDIAFCKCVKKRGRLVMVQPALVTSARRFRAGGIVRTYLKMACLHVLHWLRIPTEYLARLY